MDKEISDDLTVISVDRIYQAISEIRYSFSKCLDECRILNFVKRFLDSNEIKEDP